MTDTRRIVLWTVFLMSLFLLWDAWNRHNGQGSFFAPTPRPAASAAAASGSGVPAPSLGAAGAAASTAPPVTAANAPVGEQVTITTDVVRAVFDSKGGDLVRLELLHQQDMNDPSKPVVLFDRSAQRTYLEQSGLISAQPGVALPNHQTLMKVVDGPRSVAAGGEPVQLRFESPDGAAAGVKLIKTYTFTPGSYTIGVRHEVVNGSNATIDPQLYLQLVRDGSAPPGESSLYFTFTGPATYTDAGKFRKIEFKHLDKNDADYERKADNGWIAIVQHYFATAWLLPAPQQREFRAEKIGNNLYSVAMVLPLGQIAPGASKTQDATLFAGPQEEHKLAALAPGLELVKDYGWFTILAKPLFWLLTKLHGLIGNWGWAIVALVVLLKIALYWLNASAYRSMAKMKAINPKVMELRERLKDKPQQMQQEMMRIYREEKVNPLGSCLPIVAQMPIFIALYWVLLSSVEMRHAPWIGWITDLSAKDPYFVLPILMTLTSLFQVWLNPTPPDPVQARMMWIMPLAFSVMFFFFPAGLVLYWLTNNILSIAQQWLINKQLGVLGK